ncbi:MAG TPA: hypothetical protein VMV27_10530 [Candidatus Binataceae bacterium]|nr:hypothetical protein [Candidatus Binataceae bacterium]
MLNNDRTPRPPALALAILLAIPILFSAIGLFAEFHCPAPSLNDDVFHYLFVKRANQAISNGANPVDHWLPELELGFAQFLYYQHLPHLAIVAAYRLMLRRVSLLTIFNLVRYLLMVLFPLAVYYSMRTAGFSRVAAAGGGAFSPLLSSQYNSGFDLHSYLWSGFGLYTQLWAMPLLFVATAWLYRVLRDGRGYALAIVAGSGVLLSDLLYGYIFAVCGGILWIVTLWESRGYVAARKSLLRLMAVALPIGLITAYLTVPFLLEVRYLNASVYLERDKYDSYGAHAIFAALGSGRLFDDHRIIPVVTILAALGLGYAIATRRDEAKLVLAMFAIWMVLFLGRATWGPLADLLPLAHRMLFHRFEGGVDFAAILAVGLGAELLWNWCGALPAKLGQTAAISLLVLLMIPAMTERWGLYRDNAGWMRTAQSEYSTDTDFAKVLATLRSLPPGRVYSGTRANWGASVRWGYVHLFDGLAVSMLPSVAPPYYAFSLNSDLLWIINEANPQTYRTFNIRYIVAPPRVPLPAFLRPILVTRRYILYQADSGGFTQLGQITQVAAMGSDLQLFVRNQGWLKSTDPERGRFTAFVRDPARERSLIESPPTAALGTVEDEAITPDLMRARVNAAVPALLVFKMTYHPNWHVTVDGSPARTLMVSPSYLGVPVAAGVHEVAAEYRSSPLKNVLLAIGIVTLVAVIALGIAGPGLRL